MSDDRLFSDAELKTMGKRTLDLLREKLDGGDIEQAKILAQQMYNEFLGMHDLYRDWITHLFTFIGKDFPAYCAHCYFQNISPVEPGGKPLFETHPSEDPGRTPCRICIYK